MGTNYFHEADVCDKCGRSAERTHIGKSSAGWTFSFQATEDIRSWKDWQAKLEAGGRILNEYDEEYTLAEFKDLIVAKQKPWGKKGEPPLVHAVEMRKDPWARGSFLDPDGHSFSEGEFS